MINSINANANAYHRALPEHSRIEPVQLPEELKLSPENRNKLNDYAQDKIDAALLTLKEKQQAEWKLMLGKSYVDSQKAVINAYTLSAHGEALYETDEKTHGDESIFGIYASLEQQLLQEKKIGLITDKKPDKVEILPLVETNNLLIQEYVATKNQANNSFLHLSV